MNTFDRLVETIKKGNGFTVNLLGNEATEGFAVATSSKSREVNIGKLDRHLVKPNYIEYHLQEFIRTNLIALMNGAYIGCWQYNGDVIFDISEVEQDEYTARTKGRQRGQTAIFDLTTKREISL